MDKEIVRKFYLKVIDSIDYKYFIKSNYKLYDIGYLRGLVIV